MTLRPYSFRFDPPIRDTLLPWRDKLGADFDSVVSRLTDRDRQIEDHLNLNVGQGYLSLATLSTTFNLTTSYQVVTEYTQTVRLPAKRKIKITLHVPVFNTGAVNGVVDILIKDNGTQIGSLLSRILGPSGGGDNSGFMDLPLFPTLDAGVHVITLEARMFSGTTGSLSSVDDILSIEDIGPG